MSTKTHSSWLPSTNPQTQGGNNAALYLCWWVTVWVCLIFGWFCRVFMCEFVYFWLILWCPCYGGDGWQWWVVVVGLFAMVGLCVVGDAGLHWLAAKIMDWRERVRGRERMWEKRKKKYIYIYIYIESYHNYAYMHGYCSTFWYI